MDPPATPQMYFGSIAFCTPPTTVVVAGAPPSPLALVLTVPPPLTSTWLGHMLIAASETLGKNTFLQAPASVLTGAASASAASTSAGGAASGHTLSKCP